MKFLTLFLSAITLMVSFSASAFDVSQVVTDSTNPAPLVAVDQPKVGTFVMMAPADAVKWGEANKANPLARLPVYQNPKIRGYAQLWTWWRLQDRLAKEAKARAAVKAKPKPD